MTFIFPYYCHKIEMQKLTSQTEYYEHRGIELETELRDAVNMADTTDRDAR